ncbi:MAG: serine--tRNA ligase [Proteobacteria bacterium]|nr:serine--tRNA ligase [Pseudomonadota bacterium]
MLDLKTLTANTDEVKQSLGKRHNTVALELLSSVAQADNKRRELIQKVEALKASRNQASQEIVKVKKSGGDDAPILQEMKRVAGEIKLLDEELVKVEESLSKLVYEFPNILDPSVPAGKSSEENVEVRRWGTPRKFSFTPKTHDEIGERLGILDFKKAGEVTGARFCFLKGQAARLERALIQFMLDTHLEHGYEEMIPPFLVNRRALVGTGQLPKFEEDVFRIEKFDFFLIPTAEVPVTNYHRDEILEEAQLPRSYVAYTPCFRSEAGSYGKDTKGLKRQHQFNKVELVKIVSPEQSEKEHELLTGHAEKILQKLELPYRVVLLCGGDTGFSSRKTYDIEVYSPATQGFMEISSCSNFGDFQARRAGIRYRSASTGRPQFCHTLNGSGLAVGRTLMAIMENYQQEDGTFTIPEVLKPYFATKI